MISIIIPTYNRLDMLKKAIGSVNSQTYKDIEIVIIDDNSTDSTEVEMKEMAEKNHHILYYRNSKNMGPGFNRNLGFIKSHGEYVIFLDDDDYYTDKTFFENALEIFCQNRDLACVSGNALIENVTNGKVSFTDIGFTGRMDGQEYLLKMNKSYRKPLSTFTTVFNRAVLNQADIMNMKMVNDIAIYMRALLYGDIYVLSNCIGNYLVHNNNISFRIERDFLLDNMKERLWVSKRMLNDKSVINNWLIDQFISCYSYYVRGSHPIIRLQISIIFFILKNTKHTMNLYIRLLYVLLIENNRNLFST